jgi:hypothetical protein
MVGHLEFELAIIELAIHKEKIEDDLDLRAFPSCSEVSNRRRSLSMT